MKKITKEGTETIWKVSILAFIFGAWVKTSKIEQQLNALSTSTDLKTWQ